MDRCANTEYLNAYMRTVDQEEKRLDAIDRRKAQLLESDFSSSSAWAALEALHEIPESIGEQISLNMAHVNCAPNEEMKSVFYAVIGRIVADYISQFCEKEAQAIAERDVDNASCHNCFDLGCKFCMEKK